jgi:diguanylate cyclase (GGDEF)-like protein
VWYEHLARRDLPFPSLADVGYLGAIPSWLLVLGPVFRAGEGSVPEQAIVLAYPVGDVVLATIVFVVVARSRVAGAPVLLLGAGLLSLAVADTSFAHLTQEGPTRPGPCPTSAGSPATCWWLGGLEHQAFHDGLTSLPNRALFRERVGHALRRRSQAGTPLALLFIDLDDFKTVNDELGHAAGDDLLVAVAGRLQTCVRGEDTVARLGGDEFAILLEQAPSHEVAVRVAGRILESMGPPFPLQGHQVQVGASVGVTVSQAADVDAVLREADVAMYTAKARGKGRFEMAATSA